MARLGQNFLKSKAIAKRMADEAGIKKGDAVLEIGPGRGILTEELLKKSGKVIAVEKDPELFNFLNQKFAAEEKSGKLVLIRADIRDVLKFPKRYSLY
ncbi:MAG: ribosomal RNA small subunit methyltransferase A, partial [Candidatus Niyogibacteria bacterium]|nr:ribosomal RNA small subunit methyltransferase A [Candidatus Niyogibacteria bacterium]